jgi:hypothetical protein
MQIEGRGSRSKYDSILDPETCGPQGSSEISLLSS